MRDLAKLINRLNGDTKLNTPDFILARYCLDCLNAVVKLEIARNQWKEQS